MTCKDCMHYKLCEYNTYQEAHYFGKDKKIYVTIDNNSPCKYFTDHSEWVHLPCKPDTFEQTYEPVNNANTLKLTCSNNWISVKDRLPEDDKDVLVYNSRSKEIIMASYNSNCEEWDNLYDYLPINEITYWQPLPELPEVEK